MIRVNKHEHVHIVEVSLSLWFKCAHICCHRCLQVDAKSSGPSCVVAQPVERPFSFQRCTKLPFDANGGDARA